jgi:hypothetical protein
VLPLLLLLQVLPTNGKRYHEIRQGKVAILPTCTIPFQNLIKVRVLCVYSGQGQRGSLHTAQGLVVLGMCGQLRVLSARVESQRQCLPAKDAETCPACCVASCCAVLCCAARA